MALAGVVIASHYAALVARELHRDAQLWAGPAREGDPIAAIPAGTRFDLLDSRGGWSWGYAGAERLVGYIAEEALL